MKNLVYTCVFSNRQFIEFLELLLVSTKKFGNLENDIDFLILTHQNFRFEIERMYKKIKLENVIIHCLDLTTVPEAKSARLYIFDIPMIYNYDKILYIDTDAIVTNDLHFVFNNDIKDKLYVVSECTIDHEYFGKNYFDFTKINPLTPGFNSGVLYFKPCETIKSLFQDILTRIKSQSTFEGLVDQPFFNYYAISKGLNDASFMHKYSTNHPYKFNKHMCICHFPGSNNFKYKTMSDFLDKICVETVN